MSIQIYQDSENLNTRNHNKKIKRDDSRALRKDVPKPSKRTALGTITNTLVGSRVQPSRAAKDKHKNVSVPQSKRQQGENFKVFNDQQTNNKNDKENGNVLHSSYTEALSTSLSRKDSPMILSPVECEMSSFEEVKSDDTRSPQINDITEKLDPTYGCPEYSHDIHNYLKKAENTYRGKPQYMKKQTDINNSMRSILIDWLVEVAEEYKLQSQTLFLTVNYIDRFLSQMSVLRGKLQLVGAACMLVASKFEEIYPPEVAEFVYITDDTYTNKQVLRMEHLILKTLSFNLSVPTCDSFMTRYLLAAGAKNESQLYYLVKYLCELTLIDYDITMKHTPSMIVASAVYLGSKMLDNENPWTPTLEFYTGYEVFDMKSCVHDMSLLMLRITNHPQQAVQQKYKSAKFGGVSQIPFIL